MNRNQRATRNTAANKPFVSGGVMTNFTATPAPTMNIATAAAAPAPVLVQAQAQAINVGLTIKKREDFINNFFLRILCFLEIFFSLVDDIFSNKI